MKQENRNKAVLAKLNGTQSTDHPFTYHPEFLRNAVLRNHTGFTLIELLVVVLIIGILAGIAVPQYQKAIHKTEMAGVLETFRSIHQAMEVYHLANGSWPTNMDDLDISLPADAKWRYSLVNSTGREDSLWPNGFRGQPRGRASIRADKPSMGPADGYGAVFYSIPGRTAYNAKPGVFCCLIGSGTGLAKWRKFCNASKISEDVGACYTGTKVNIYLNQ